MTSLDNVLTKFHELSLGLFCLWMTLGALTTRTNVGVTVETRYGLNQSSAVSSLFILDTRFSGSVGTGASGNFSVDTRGGLIAGATINGAVSRLGGGPFPGVVVEAIQGGVLRASTLTDDLGNYRLQMLPAGIYTLRARRTDWLTGHHFGVTLAPNQTIRRDFTLEARPPTPIVETIVRTPEPKQIPTRNIPASDQLKLFVNGQFESGRALDPNKMTIVMTHGWRSKPDVWATNMAAEMVKAAIDANIVAWDWKEVANHPEPSILTWLTPGEGLALGQTLYQTLGQSYEKPVHFIGHSLGTLVNAAAANYIHGDAPRSQDRISTPWLPTRTHLTLLDEAELATVIGQITYSENYTRPIPARRAWIDNYYSIAGFPRAEAVNIYLGRAHLINGPNVVATHGYPCRWYILSVGNPTGAIVGHRYSFERMNHRADFPTPSPFPYGFVFIQDPSLFKPELDLIVPVTIAGGVAAATEHFKAFASRAYQGTVNVVNGAVQKVGDVTSNIKESFIRSLELVPERAVGGSALDAFNAFSVSLSLRTVPASPVPRSSSNIQRMAAEPSLNQPAYAWLSVAVPPNSATMVFDFALEGAGADDFVAAGINGTNVFALENRFIPENVTVNSGPIDVSKHAGQTVELFFGIVGGTSTNASLTVEAIRFYSITPPPLSIAAGISGGGQAVLSWPMWATNYALESTVALSPSQWGKVTDTVTIAGFQNIITNAVGSATRFYRLKEISRPGN